MATRTGPSAMQQAAELGMDPANGYAAALDPSMRPNGEADSGMPEQDGVEAELFGDRTREDLAGLAGQKLRMPAAPPPVDVTAHNANLIELIPETERDKLARDLLEEIRSAELSRKPWVDMAVMGIKALGFDRTKDKRDDPFPGASAVVHPLFAKALVDMQARTSRELSPPEGPARTELVGQRTQEQEDRADRVARALNWQCTDQMWEWQGETDRLLMMVGAEGSSFKKIWYDPNEKRPRAAYIPAQNIIAPFSAACEMTSPLVAERLEPLRHEIEANVASGFWAKHRIGDPADMPVNEIKEVQDSIVGLTRGGSEDQPAYRPYEYFECQVTRSIPGIEGGKVGEYLVTVAVAHQELVAVRRNWPKSDTLRRRRRLLQHYKLWPWSGFYGVGLWHMIGGLSASATGSLRALLDSAMWVNMPGGFKLPGARTNGGTVTRAPGEVVELQVPASVRDIRMAIMPDPHPGPSPVLFELLGFVAQQGSEFASIALQETEAAGSSTPVGTTLARVDEGSRVYSGVFQRLHRVQGHELRAIYDIDRETIDEQMAAHVFQVPELQPGDFAEGIAVVPVSDPRTYSQIQRALSAQARLELAERAKAQGINVDLRGAYVDTAKAMQLQNADELFPPEPDPFSGDPFTENNTAITGGKLTVKPEQPHEEHLIIHLPLLQLPGMIATPTGQNLMQHMIQHAGMGALAMSAAARMAMDKRKRDAALMGEMPEALPDPTEGMPDPGFWYQTWMQRIAPALLPPGDPSVDKLVAVEEAKVEATREKTSIETEGKIAIAEEQTANEREEMRLQHQYRMAEIQAENDRTEAKAVVDTTVAREKIASEERKKAADIAAKAATPPPPKPFPPDKARLSGKKLS